MQNAKKKGNAFEKEWATYIRDIDSTASRNYGSGGGVAKSDVHNQLGYNFECKRVEHLNIWQAIQQAERDASLAHSIPAVVFRRNRQPDPYVAIPAWHFKELIKTAKEPKTTQTESRTLQWAIKNTIQALKRLLKELE